MEHAVTMPLRCASIAPDVIPASRPTSSAVTTSLFNLDQGRGAREAQLHVAVGPEELAEDLADDREGREVRDAMDAGEIIESDLLNDEAAVARLHDQLCVDERSFGLEVD